MVYFFHFFFDKEERVTTILIQALNNETITVQQQQTRGKKASSGQLRTFHLFSAVFYFLNVIKFHVSKRRGRGLVFTYFFLKRGKLQSDEKMLT